MLAFFCAIDPESGSAGAEVLAQDGGCSVLCFPRESLTRAEWPDHLDPAARFEEVAVELVPAGINDHATARRPAHQLFGTPSSIQDDILSEIAAIHEDDVEHAADRWRLLIQIDEDPTVGFEWGDAGRLYTAIPHTDLIAGELGRAFCLTQSN